MELSHPQKESIFMHSSNQNAWGTTDLETYLFSLKCKQFISNTNVECFKIPRKSPYCGMAIHSVPSLARAPTGAAASASVTITRQRKPNNPCHPPPLQLGP